MALADDFEENDAGGHGNVKRTHGAGGGDGNEEIAALAREFMQALALAAEDDSNRTGEINSCVVFLRPFVQPNEPVACFF